MAFTLFASTQRAGGREPRQTPTGNDAEWVKTRQKNIIATGFKVALEEAEVMSTTHGSARQGRVIGWLAIMTGTGTWNGHAYPTPLRSGTPCSRRPGRHRRS